MTIDEAIRMNTVLKGAPVLKDNPKIINTLNLNIEALKRQLLLREHPKRKFNYLLVGETKD